MSHTIASVSQAAYLPKEQALGIPAVQSQPSFGYEQEDAFEREELANQPRRLQAHTTNTTQKSNPLFRLIIAFKRLLSRLATIFR